MGSQPQRVIVTRPAHDAAHWVDELTKSGFEAAALPLIEIGPASGQFNTHALGDAWQHLGDYTACMFVSGNAVEYFFKQNRAAEHKSIAQEAINSIAIQDLETIPVGLRFLAPGPATAAALLAAGVPAGQIDSPPLGAGQFDSEALWHVVGQRVWQDTRVLVVCGQTSNAAQPAAAGRDWLAQQLRAAGAQVDALAVYQRRVPQLTPTQLELAQAASQDGSVWLFSSSEALVNLLKQPGLAAVNWGKARAVATHPRIAQAVRAAHWGVVQESRPLLADITGALRSIESGAP